MTEHNHDSQLEINNEEELRGKLSFIPKSFRIL